MDYKEEILDELKTLAPVLVPLQHRQVYEVPLGYFDQFSDNLVDILKNQPGSVLPPPVSVMSVPQGYFQQFAASVIQKIKLSEQSAADEIQALSPALFATGNDNVFTVPQTYFDQFPASVVGQIQEKAPVVIMKQRSAFARYAAAAVITGLLGLTTFSLFNNKENDDMSSSTSLAMADAKDIINTNSFERVLETVSDEEIVGFLQSRGQDVKAALVASSIDSKDLPAADEYIKNENTLNNYLESLDITYPN